jgi:NAD(P)-dependent dehydrogenase (short-subunit alcohol dehydrogenase family)
MSVSERPVALVTGARRGIGRGISYALAERGFDIVVCDLEQDDNAQETLQGISRRGSRGEFVQGDIADLDRQQDLLDTAIARFGRIDCLVNNAGVQVLVRGDLLEVSVDSYNRCMDINLRGTFFLTQHFARYLLANPTTHGHHRSIVTISSINAVAASLNRGEYCISKTGLSMLTKLFALRLADAGVGVYEIRPGIIATDMTAAATVKQRYDEFIASGNVPIARWGQPQDIGKTVATLASGDLPYTAGQAIFVDGGLNVSRL